MSDVRIVIICALEAEARPLRKRLAGRADVRVRVTGMGPANAARGITDLLNRVHPGLVVAAGFAGGLDPALTCGQVIQPATVIDAATGISFGSMFDQRGAVMVSTDHTAATPDRKAELRQQFNADAVDMETATIARICTERGVNWQAVRIITDTAGQSLPAMLSQLVDDRGRSRPLAACIMLLRRPGFIGPLCRIGNNARRCARQLAQTLTDMINAEHSS